LQDQKFDNISGIKNVALLLVILGHVSLFYSGKYIYTSLVPSSIINALSSYVYTFHVPVFFFASGYLYCAGKAKGRYNKAWAYIKGKMNRLLLPYLLVAGLFLLPIKICLGFYPDYAHILKNVLLDLMFTTNIHNLWFLPSLFLVFVVFYCLDRFITNSSLLLLVVVILHGLGRSGLLPLDFQLDSAAQSLLYFYFGYIVMKNQAVLKPYYKAKYAGIFFLLHLANCVIRYGCKGHLHSYAFKAMFATLPSFAALLGIAFTFIGVTVLLNRYSNIVDNSYYKTFDRYNFPIYLFHEGVLIIILGVTSHLIINPFLFVFSCFIACILISLLLIKLLEKNRYLKSVLL
jgi:fucose 4-O-acetylase-like acetyltransferase